MMTERSEALQVDSSHYEFLNYVPVTRWISYYYQVEQIVKLNATDVLEIGAGSKITASVLRSLGIDVKTLDFDSALSPDFYGSVLDMPVDPQSFDVVAAFQILEHLPYENFSTALKEIKRVARRFAVISLPDAKRAFYVSIEVPKIGVVKLHLSLPLWFAKRHRFDGQHHWEINKIGYPLSRIVEDIEATGFKVLHTFRVHENPYHRFFILQC